MITRKIHWRVFLLLGLTIGAVFLLAPLSSQAAWYDYLTPTGLASGFVGLILKIILGITGLLVRFANWFITWTLGNPYNISYTRPGLRPPDNFIIEIGWTLLRDLVNMAFILGLAYIGFSTALDFGNKFKTKNTFLKLLLIALLINFTPAICGAVVDVGNILGSFFIQGADFSTLSAIFERQQGFLSRDWSNIITDGTLMFNTLMLIGFGIVAALVLSIYGILFLARGPIIWLLVILSPAAFFCYIFEKTKKQFDQWWELFLQWALILPVLLGFFLYLSMQILARTSEIMSVSGGEVSGFLNRILPYTIPVGFLIAGLFLTTSKLMGGGAKAILGVAKGAALGAAGGVGAYALSAGKKGVTGARNTWRKQYGDAVRPGEEGYEEWKKESKMNQVRSKMNSMGRFAFGGAQSAETANWSKGKKVGREVLRAGLGFATLGATYWANPARRRINSKIGATIDEEQDKKFDDEVNKLKDKPVSVINDALQNAMPGIVGRQQRLIAGKAAILNKAPLKAFTALTPEMKKQLIKDAINDAQPDKINHFKALDPILTAEVVSSMNPSETWRKKVGLDVSEEDKKAYGNYRKNKKDANGNIILDANGNAEKEGEPLDALAAKIMAEARISQTESFDLGTVKIAADYGLINDFWNGPMVGKAGELLGSKAVKAIQDNMENEDYYQHKQKDGHGGNTQLWKYIDSQTGAALGLSFRDDMGTSSTTGRKADIKEEIKKLEVEVENKKIESSKAQRASDIIKQGQINREIKELEKKKSEKAKQLADLEAKEKEAKNKKT